MKPGITFLFLSVIGLFVTTIIIKTQPKPSSPIPQTKFARIPTDTPAFPTLTPSPTQKPKTSSQTAPIPKPPGPCVTLPVLTYHHIEPRELSVSKKRSGLGVTPEAFTSHLQYLKDKQYTTITTANLIHFFDSGTPLPSKSILLTFDDGYIDMYTYAFPLLKQYQFKAAMYLPTGLINNPDYLNWDQVQEMKSSGLVEFGNHSWSHANLKNTTSKVEYEITTADQQLADHNLNTPKTFVYPYGITSPTAIALLNKLDYQLGFTTQKGSTHCRGNRLLLPRLPASNAPLSNAGL